MGRKAELRPVMPAAGAFSFFKVGNTSGTEQPAEPVGKFRRVAREFSFHPFEKRAYAGRTSGFFRTGRNVTPADGNGR